jgi:syntaxin 16
MIISIELQGTMEPKKSPLSGISATGEKPVLLDGIDDEDDIDVASYDIGFSDQQQARAEDNRLRINQRMQEIRDIAQQVAEIGEMFNDIAYLVGQQGGLLDRIDYNIESTDANITAGTKELTAVAQGTRGFSKRLCVLALLIIVFGIVVIIVVMTKRK